MRLFTVAKWELKGTFRSRKFVLIFIFQILILLLTISMFNGFLETVTQNDAGFTPSLRGFASVSVKDPDGLLESQLNPDLLKIEKVRFIPEEGSALEVERFSGSLPVNARLYLDYSDPKRSVIRDEVKLSVQRASENLYEKVIMPSNPPPSIKEEAVGESLPVQLVTKVMVAILLFLPVFLFGNLVVDSIVGEKERKTGEVLIATPTRRSEILLGKSLAVLLTISLQVAIWVFIMDTGGFTILKPLETFLVVVLAAVPIVGLTNLIAVYSKNYREAGIGITFAYILVAGYLIVPALAHVAGSSGSLSPLTLAIKLIGGDPLSIKDVLIPTAAVLILSTAFYWASVRLFEMDDVFFGPRPGLMKLLVRL